MELRATRELRRNAQLDRVMGKKADTPDTSTSAQAPQRQAPADKLTLSQQALAFAEEQRRQMWDAAQEREQKKQDRIGGMLDAMDTQKRQLDSMEKKLDTMNKCQKIAAAVMRGDRVPPEDLRYLMEHDKEGYKMAMAMRRPKKDPKDVESVLDEEDRNGGQTKEADGGGEAPSVEAAGASGSGGGLDLGTSE